MDMIVITNTMSFSISNRKVILIEQNFCFNTDICLQHGYLPKMWLKRRHRPFSLQQYKVFLVVCFGLHHTHKIDMSLIAALCRNLLVISNVLSSCLSRDGTE